MAQKTRQVTQYEIYRLYEVVRVKVGTTQEKGKKVPVTRDERVEVAIFDDETLLKATIKTLVTDRDGIKENHVEWEAVPEWVEYEPEQSRFSLPINPTVEYLKNYGTD